MRSLRFEDFDVDPCNYYNQDRSIIMVLHVDDGMMIGKYVKSINKVLDEMNFKFKITCKPVSNDPINYLGMQIKSTMKEIFISQSEYVQKMLKRFRCDNMNPVFTPIEHGMMTDEENFVNDEPFSKSAPYGEAVGSLLCLDTMSRPSISFCVNYLSRFNDKPMKSHWKMVKRVFQYLKGTVIVGITFNEDRRFVASSNSDFGGDLSTRKSTSEVLLLLGGTLIWCTQVPRLVATLSAEAEYRAEVSTFDEVS